MSCLKSFEWTSYPKAALQGFHRRLNLMRVSKPAFLTQTPVQMMSSRASFRRQVCCPRTAFLAGESSLQIFSGGLQSTVLDYCHESCITRSSLLEINFELHYLTSHAQELNCLAPPAQQKSSPLDSTRPATNPQSPSPTVPPPRWPTPNPTPATAHARSPAAAAARTNASAPRPRKPPPATPKPTPRP